MVKLPNYSNKKWYIGVDVGGTKIATQLVDRNSVTHSQLTVPTNLTSPHHTLMSIIDTIRQTLAQANARLEDLIAVGMGVPGQVDPDSGVVNLAVNLNWHHFDAGYLMAETLGAPCFLENDVRAAALGVYRFQHNQTIKNLAYISVGTGLAAGVILKGKLYRGTHGMAGEVGHIIIDPQGPRCQCGAQGCLETFVAGPSIARQAQEAVTAGQTSVLSQLPVITTKDVYTAADAGDKVAIEIIRKVGHYLGRAIQSLLMSYDVERVVLGGGVTKVGQGFLQPILAEFARQRETSPLAQMMLPDEVLQLVPAGYNAGTWGAIAVAEKGVAFSLKDSSLQYSRLYRFKEEFAH